MEPWYDWCMVEWGDDSYDLDIDDMSTEHEITSLPAKILCFLSFGDGEEKVVIHSCKYQQIKDRNTNVTEQ